MPFSRVLLAVLIAVFSSSVVLAEELNRPTESPSLVVVPESSTKVSPELSNFLKDKDASLDSTCYTMRTYMLKKDAPDTDSVHPVGYTTCQPALHYEMKVTRKPTAPALVW